MPNYNQRQRQPVDYANLYFGFLVWRAILKAIIAVICCGFAILYLIAYSIWPDEAPDVAATIVVLSIAGGIFAFIYILVGSIYRFFIPRRPETMNESFVRIGLVPNPPEPWFDDDGKPLWQRTNTGWQKIHKDS